MAQELSHMTEKVAIKMKERNVGGKRPRRPLPFINIFRQIVVPKVAMKEVKYGFF